ncbi:MAG: hypothetical protein ABIH34_00665 [Nanoarchaeota archaeon]
MVTLHSYLFLLVLLVAAPFVGMIIALRSKEEMPSGKHYFIILLPMLYVLAKIVFSMAFFKLTDTLIMFFLMFSVILLMWLSRRGDVFVKRPVLGYSMSALYLGAAALFGALLEMAMVVLIIGFMQGSLTTAIMLEKRKKTLQITHHIARQVAVFLIISLGFSFFLA